MQTSKKWQSTGKYTVSSEGCHNPRRDRVLDVGKAPSNHGWYIYPLHHLSLCTYSMGRNENHGKEAGEEGPLEWEAGQDYVTHLFLHKVDVEA